MESRVQKAAELHDKGYNCAQAVVCTYADLFDLETETAFKMSEAFGLGMGQMQVCGALSGACMLAGLSNSGGTAGAGKTKGKTYKLSSTLIDAFRDRAQSIVCRELKGVDTGVVLTPCSKCIADASQLVEEYLLG